MTKADGEIIIDSEINTDGAEAGATDINKALEKIVKQLESIAKTAQTICNKMGKSFSTASEGIDQTAESAKKTQNAIKETGKEAKQTAKEIEKAFMTVTNDEGKFKLFDDGSIEWIEKNADKYKDTDNEQPRVVELGGAKQYDPEQIQKEIEELSKGTQKEKTLLQQIQEAKAELKKLEADGFGAGDDKYDSAQKRLIGLTAELRSYTETMVYETQKEGYTLDTLEGKIAEVQAKIAKLKSYGLGVEDPEMQTELKNLAELKEKYKQVYTESTKTEAQKQKEAEAAALAAQKEEEAIRKNEAKIAAMNQKLEETRAKEVQAAVEAKRIAEIAQNAEVSDEYIVKLNNELSELQLRMKDLKAAGVTSGYVEYDDTATRISEIKAQLKDYDKSLTVAEENTSIFSNAIDKLKNTASGVKGVFANVVRLIKSTSGKLSKLGGYITGADKKTKSMNVSFNGGLKTILKYGLGIRSLYALFGKLRSAMVTGFQNLAQYSNTTNASISSVMSALTRLKNSLATAFSPILNIVAPVLTKFINMLSTAITYIGMFIAALTGQSSYTKAVGVNEDYAASLGDTADAASDAAEATGDAEKAAKSYLTSLDNINKVDSDTTSNSGSGSGSGNGGNGTSVSDMFETVAIDSTFKDLAEKVKGYMMDILEPIKDAWNTYGESVMNAWKGAIESIIDTVETVGKTFKDVWTDGTGYAFCSNILKIVRLMGSAAKGFSDAFRNAWNDNNKGYKYIKSIFNMFNSILSLINTIGSDLVIVWSKGSGQIIIGTILKIFTNIHETIGKIAFRLEEAWKKNETGQTIIKNIFNIVESILKFVEGITESTKKWADALNFSPLLQSIADLTGSISPLVDEIGRIFQKWWDNIIEPMLKWLIETGIPTVINIVSNLFNFLSEHEGLLETIMTLMVGMFAYKTISPLASGIVGCIQDIASSISGDDESKLVGSLKNASELITGKFANAIETMKTSMSKNGGLISVIKTAATHIGDFATAIAPLVGTAGLIVGAGVAAVYATSKLAEFIEKMQGGNGIGGTFGNTTNNLIHQLQSQGDITSAAAEELFALRESLETADMSEEDMVDATTQLVSKLGEMGVTKDQAVEAFTAMYQSGAITDDMFDILKQSIQDLGTETTNMAENVNLGTKSAEDAYDDLEICVGNLTNQFHLGIDEQGKLTQALLNTVDSGGTAQDAYNNIMQVVEDLGLNTETAAKIIAEAIPEAVTTVANTAETEMAATEQSVTTHITNAQNTITNATGTIASTTATDMASASSSAATELAEISAVAESELANAKGVVSSYTGEIASVTSSNMAQVQSDASTYLSGVSGIAGTEWDNSYKSAYAASEGIKNAVSNGLKEVQNKVEINMGTIRDTFSEYFGYIIANTKKALGSDLKNVLEVNFPNLISMCRNYGKEMGQAVADGISSKSNIIKNTLNNCISKTNGAISNINSALSSVERAFTFSYSYSNPVNNMSGTIRSSLSLGRVGSVPYLASGAVIPPRSEFLAVLGDQKNGTNIETPESLLRKIFREEMGNQNNGGQYKFTAQINRRTLFEEMISEAKLARSQSGKNPFALE